MVCTAAQRHSLQRRSSGHAPFCLLICLHKKNPTRANLIESLSFLQDGENILYGTGDDLFMKGVRTYLKAHLYNTSTSTDLWEALSTAVGHNVGAWMHGWTFQRGYPLVHVTLGGITNRDVFVLQVPPKCMSRLFSVQGVLRTLIVFLQIQVCNVLLAFCHAASVLCAWKSSGCCMATARCTLHTAICE